MRLYSGVKSPNYPSETVPVTFFSLCPVSKNTHVVDTGTTSVASAFFFVHRNSHWERTPETCSAAKSTESGDGEESWCLGEKS